ncbi:integrase [Salmonella enterica subsp. enterica]|nr:integrase [Salmonella enterica subsp. enterica serovar Bonn]EBZ5939445.1 integrase [Salmonella enterica subsp. enterica serovar Muenchen]EDM3391100.1 integrase [Salmonella enterica subsp. enterica serovar Newport]EDP8924058.1 tyrosine-type recombinase/integrase [Salmonella enterica subsp. enterica serovar Hadar]EIV1965885.1 tyrosine-type recombinase/integrase [Salmonella enterica subsp. enterica serovar Mgulani]MJN97732.1 integrase [Salmonella enterica subsp. enterica serovar Richmond]
MTDEREKKFVYVPFCRAVYNLHADLSSEQKEALSTRHKRSCNYGSSGSLSPLITPLLDIAANSGTRDKLTRTVIMAMLTEMQNAGQPCWNWQKDRWISLFDKYHRGKPLMMAFAYHLGPFASPLQIPHEDTLSLYARAIYGSEMFSYQLNRLSKALISLGYAPRHLRHAISSPLGLLMLLNDNPHLENMTTELLWQAQQYHNKYISKHVGKISHGLAALGIIANPIRMRNYTEWNEKPVENISPEWVVWCRRWRETSVLRPRTRENQYSFILRCGLWLAKAHPDVKAPTDWSIEICASFIAAVGRIKVGELSLGTVRGLRQSRRSGEPMMPHSRAHFIYSLRRFMSDFELWGWGRLKFSPARHLCTPNTPLFRRGVNPRVIDDPVWLKLIWASLNLRHDDLLSDIHYPLSMLQAMAVIWTHAGLRQNEILRLTTECVTPQSEDIIREDGSIVPAGTLCYLNVPAGKTSKAFVKPVSVVVKKYVDIWLNVRPLEQAKLNDDRTGEKVRYLFQYRGKPAGSDVINRTVIPVLCARAGLPVEDSGGTITSHRGRASALTALASVPQGMSLYELMQWSGHSTPQSTLHYIRIRPTQLAASFVKADRVAHMISVLVDHDPEAVTLTGPATYYDLGESFCTNPFWSSCPHRMACTGCDFNLLKDSARGLILESKASIRRYLEEVPLTPDEKAIVEQDIEKVEQALARLTAKT